MAKKELPIEGGSVTKEFLSGFKSEKEFMVAMEDKTYAHLFEGDNREAKLKEAYGLYQPTEVKEPAAGSENRTGPASNKPGGKK